MFNQKQRKRLKQHKLIKMSVHFPVTHRRYMHYRKKDDFVVVKYGAEWCGPCKKISPLLEELAKNHKNVYFLDVDVDTEQDPNEEMAMIDHPDFKNIRTIPHFKFFLDKELVREFHGADAEKLQRYVKRYSAPKLVPDEVVDNIVDEIEKTLETNTN